MKNIVALIIATLAVAGCATLTGPDDGWVYAYHGQRMHPEGWYRYAYEQMASCAAMFFEIPSGKRYGDIEWYMVPAGSMVRASGGVAIGTYSAPDRIYLDERWVMESYVIYHEIGHYLTNIGHERAEDWAVLEYGCILPLTGHG